MLEKINQEAKSAVLELIEVAKLSENDILVVGCSSSEVSGYKIGTFSALDVAKSIFDAIYSVISEKKIFLAAQCCEHLNRAIIIEKELAKSLGIPAVNVIPQPKAGGSFATCAYSSFSNPVAVENIKADAGIDIGATLIGMHLKEVAVPVRISVKKIGSADVICARTRPKYIGGSRAIYDDKI